MQITTRRGRNSETPIQQGILKYLCIYTDGKWIRYNNASIYNPKLGKYIKPNKMFQPDGVSDIVGWWRGKGYSIEVKTREEYLWLMKNYERLKNGIAKGKKETHFKDQIMHIEIVKKTGNIGFFTYSLEHCLDTLGIKHQFNRSKDGEEQEH